MDVSKKYRAMTFMAVLALVSLAIHFWMGWEAFVTESASHNEKALWGDYMIQWLRDTFENLQSEFWQLAAQFALLAGLFKFIGVEAYEEDEEHVKQELADIQRKLDELTQRA